MKVTIDGHEVEAEKGELVIAVAERAGIYIPRFCYHPRMRTVGMCRMCLVNVDAGRGPALTASCVAEVADNMVVDTQAPAVKKAQDGVLEFLLINHPLDCPVCDKGGECPLQDQTLHFGPGESRFVEEKRHFEKPIPISDLVLLDRERCILCDRCTRFSKEVAGDPLIHFINRGNATEVNTFPDHPFASYFSGNVVQICPVGALTSAPYRFTARPWDIERVESTCTSCALGCRVAIESSANRITRYQGLDSEAVNHSWLCDRGRFDFEWLNSEDRLTAPLVRKGDELVEASWGEALSAASSQLADVMGRFGPEAIGVIGGARLTNEDAYAWAKLAKGILGTDNVDAQLGDGLPAEMVLGLPQATIDAACTAPAVILVAPDVKEELPVLFLRLRDAIVAGGLKVVEVTPRPTSLSPLVAASIVYRPGEAADVVAALVAGADPAADVGGVAAASVIAARSVLAGVSAPVVVVGRPSLAESAEGIVGAAAAIRRALPDATFLVALRRGNVRGALDLGLAPGVLPGRVGLDAGRGWFERQWGKVPVAPGLDTAGMLAAAADGRLQALVLLGADPLADFPDRELARRALSSIGCVIALDTFLTESSRHATVVFAAAGYGEKEGTTTNIEGRVTGVTQKVVAAGTAWADWMIASELARRLGGDLGAESHDDLWHEIERVSAAHRGMTLALLRAPGRWDGVVAPPLGDPAAGAGTFADVVAADQSAAFAPLTVVDGSTGSVGLRVRGGAAGLAAAQAAARGVSVADAPLPVDSTLTASDPAPDAAEQAAESSSSESAPSEASDAGTAEGSGAGPAEASDATPPEGEEAAPAEASAATPAGGEEAAPAAPVVDLPTVLVWDPPSALPASPQLDAYSMRLVAGRAMYDQAVSVVHSPHLATLVRPAVLGVNPGELGRLGIAAGDSVRVTSARTSIVLPVEGLAGLPRGSASLVFNLAGPGAADLIDVGTAVTEVRVETT